MNQTRTGFVFGAALVGALTGCIGYVDGPGHGAVYVAPAHVQAVVVQDDYVYYPGYQVYYSSTRHQYIYLEGRAWVTRPAPPHVSVDVLFASPSVRLDFHDSPATHHTRVVKQYPKHWKPTETGPGNRGNEGNRGNSGNRGNQGNSGND